MNKLKSIRWFALLFLIMTGCSTGKGNTLDPDQEIVKGEVVTAYVTTATRSSEFVPKEISFSDRVDNMSPFTITLVSGKKHQTMDGFGTAITGSSAFNLLKMSSSDRNAFLKRTFSESDGMGQSYVRIAIGCSDFSLSEYTCCDQKGIEHFALQEEELKYIIPVLKEILAINPQIGRAHV